MNLKITITPDSLDSAIKVMAVLEKEFGPLKVIEPKKRKQLKRK